MLRRVANSVLRWSLAGILGVTSLLGSQLHDIFGIHHAGQQSGCHCEGNERALQHEPSVAAGHSEGCDEGTNCPICNYLAQGRIVGERFEGVLVMVNVPHRSPEMPLFVPSLHLLPFQARAPPAA